MREFVYIVGINGVGKSTLALKIANRLDCRYVSSSQMLREAFKVKHSYELEKIDQERLINYYTRTFLHILSEEIRPVLLDTHALVFTSDGKASDSNVTEFYPYSRGIVDIISNPMEISQRIKNDNTSILKSRPTNLTIKDITIRLRQSTKVAKEMSLEGKFPYKQFDNSNPISDSSIIVLTDIVKQLIR